MNNFTFSRAIILVTAIIIVAMAPLTSSPGTLFTQPAFASITTGSQITAQQVAIGEGSNATVQHFTFTPQTIEISAGETVTWFTPEQFTDIHTVTFVRDPSIQSDILLPFAIPAGSSATDFELLPPFTLGQPVTIPGPQGREAIVAMNKVAWYPSVVDTTNQTTYLEGTDIQATLNSSVNVLNSGIILPPMSPTEAGGDDGTGTGPPPLSPPFPPVSSFTVAFEEPGVYPYFCAIHPWMSGQVIVREGGIVANPPPVITPSQPEPQPPIEQPQRFSEEQLSDTTEEVLVEEEEQEQEPEEETECHPSYPDFCIPPPPPNLNCDDISGRRFTVLSPDPHGLDGNDNDGIGCES